MMHAKKKSVYRCPVDNRHEIRSGPGERVVCPYCCVEMQEVARGVIVKTIFSGAPDGR